jgi:hypothetical protein
LASMDIGLHYGNWPRFDLILVGFRVQVPTRHMW